VITFTYMPDAPAAAIVLSQTGRDWMESDVQLNHRRLHQAVDFFRAPYGTGYDRGNWRNRLSFKVWRGLAEGGAPFVDAEAAMLQLLDHPQSLPGHGVLKIEIQGATTRATRFLLDCLPEVVEVRDGVGITLAWQYTFTGGQLVPTLPAT
jgi:hypothetical protein